MILAYFSSRSEIKYFFVPFAFFVVEKSVLIRKNLRNLCLFFSKIVHFSLNIPAMFGIIKIASSLPLPNWGEVADSGDPQESGKSPEHSYQQIHTKKHYFASKMTNF